MAVQIFVRVVLSSQLIAIQIKVCVLILFNYKLNLERALYPNI